MRVGGWCLTLWGWVLRCWGWVSAAAVAACCSLGILSGVPVVLLDLGIRGRQQCSGLSSIQSFEAYGEDY
uniref:Secreted protein n=1 Tax=Ixodes scapularis TaxID=6945 RepID=A0A4D5S0V2_IXOSC